VSRRRTLSRRSATCIAFLICVLALPSCGGAQRARAGLEPRTGMLDVPGGKVWYQITGGGAGAPLLVLHGGPGISSQYLKPLAALGDERPVVFFDQLGAGRSDRPADSTLWTTQHFVEEVAAVRRALGLSEVHLYGHSWGTILAVEYMKTHPAGVKSLVLASPALDIPAWKHDADSLLATMPDSTQQRVRRHETDGTFDAPEYQTAMMDYYHRYLARRQPWSPDIDSTMAAMNPAIYVTMQGPSEFTITGTLKDYDAKAFLPEIQVPTLFVVGQYDEALPSTVAGFARRVPGAEMKIVPGAGHLGMQDEPDAYCQVIRSFLDRVDAKK